MPSWTKRLKGRLRAAAAPKPVPAPAERIEAARRRLKQQIKPPEERSAA